MDPNLLSYTVSALNSGGAETAARLARIAIEQNGYDTAAWHVLGHAELRLQHYAKANHCFCVCLSHNPEHAPSRQLFHETFGRATLECAAELSAAFRNIELALETRLDDLYQGKVMSGFFQGMQLHKETTWINDKSAKLLGVYESNLHPWLEQCVAQPYEHIINIGCAEGYYAVGLALKIPGAQVHAYDSDEAAQRVCFETARLNGVSERMIVAGACTAQGLNAAIVQHRRTLVFADCEGYEMVLLDPEAAPALTGTDIIVETHDFFGNRSIVDTLLQRFATTHVIAVQKETGRNPNEFAALVELPSVISWLAMCEWRPKAQTWLRLLAKEPTPA